MTDPNEVGSQTIFMPFSSDTERNAGPIFIGSVPLIKDFSHNAVAGRYNTVNDAEIEV